MPAWRVSEPFINLWIGDTPLAYQPAKGPAVEFTLSYKQRDEDAGGLSGYSSAGYGWNCSWLSYLTYEPTYRRAFVWLPGGGKAEFQFAVDEYVVLNYQNNYRLRRVVDGYGNVIRLELLHGDGSMDVYAYNQPGYLTSYYWFLSAQQDPQGRQTTLSYSYDSTSACAWCR